MTPEAADLIKKLLVVDHKKRIGVKEIKEHAFFKGKLKEIIGIKLFQGVNWDKLRRGEAPITFEHIQETDTQNFANTNKKICDTERLDPFITIPKDTNVEENLVFLFHFL